MFCQSFPDLQWLKHQAETRFSNQKSMTGESLPHAGWPTVILNVTADNIYRDNIPGPFSFFTTRWGNSIVEVNGRSTEVPADFFFLTNPGQRYTLGIEKCKPAETFNIHFGKKWAEEVLVSFSNTTETLLDEPQKGRDLNVVFYNKLFAKENRINRILQAVRETTDEGNLKREELLSQLMIQLLVQNQLLKQSALNIPVVRPSSREEIVKRLFLATDYIYAHYSTDVSLDDLAKVSCLSKFHFLRLFRQVFRQTPHQFITSIRIEKAKSMLQTSGTDVKSVAKQVGFHNPGSFSRLFRNEVGLYPTQFRAAS